jgi:hypothetical protein
MIVEEYSFSLDEIRRETKRTDISIKRELGRKMYPGKNFHRLNKI